MARPRTAITAFLALLLVIVLIYSLVSFLIVQELTRAERHPQVDHPGNYGLAIEIEEVTFTPRGTGCNCATGTCRAGRAPFI